MEKHEEQLFSVSEVSRITKLGKSTVRQKCDPKYTAKAKLLPSLKIGGRIRIRARDLYRWLEEQRRDV